MKRKYIQPWVQVVKLNACTILAGSPQVSNIRDIATGDGQNSVSGSVYDGSDYDGPQRAKAHEMWDSFDE